MLADAIITTSHLGVLPGSRPVVEGKLCPRRSCSVYSWVPAKMFVNQIDCQLCITLRVPPRSAWAHGLSVGKLCVSPVSTVLYCDCPELYGCLGLGRRLHPVEKKTRPGVALMDARNGTRTEPTLLHETLS